MLHSVTVKHFTNPLLLYNTLLTQLLLNTLLTQSYCYLTNPMLLTKTLITQC